MIKKLLAELEQKMPNPIVPLYLQRRFVFFVTMQSIFFVE